MVNIFFQIPIWKYEEGRKRKWSPFKFSISIKETFILRLSSFF